MVVVFVGWREEERNHEKVRTRADFLSVRMGRKRSRVQNSNGIIETCQWNEREGIFIKDSTWSVRTVDVNRHRFAVSMESRQRCGKRKRKKRQTGSVVACSVDVAGDDDAKALWQRSLDAVACIGAEPLEPYLTLVSYGCKQETQHRALIGQYFTVRDFMDSVGAHVTATYCVGNIDKHHICFEGLTRMVCRGKPMMHGRSMLVWNAEG